MPRAGRFDLQGSGFKANFKRKREVDISVVHDPVHGGKLDASTGPPPLRNAVMTRIVRAGPTALLPCFRVQILEHDIA